MLVSEVTGGFKSAKQSPKLDKKKEKKGKSAKTACHKIVPHVTEAGRHCEITVSKADLMNYLV